ncbi:MAG: hypothetical protein U5N85_16695 [Arcicella sp.]|nr:hypothetical protein [Arcicella sp.]
MALTVNIDTFNVLSKVATHEYAAIWRDVKRAKKLKDKYHIFNAPYWSHDGEDKRAKILRQKM